MTALDDPERLIHEPGGYLLAPQGDERVGDVSNVTFSNGWVARQNGQVFIYYASSDTRCHVCRSWRVDVRTQRLVRGDESRS